MSADGSLMRYPDGMYAHIPETLPRAGGGGAGPVTFMWGGKMRACVPSQLYFFCQDQWNGALSAGHRLVCCPGALFKITLGPSRSPAYVYLLWAMLASCASPSRQTHSGPDIRVRAAGGQWRYSR